MNQPDAEGVVRGILGKVAPGMGAETLARDADLRFALDLDSMDVLEFFLALERAFGVAVPETDYGRVGSIDACLRYLDTHRP